MEKNQENLKSSLPHQSLPKSEVMANILKGYEDFTLDSSGRIISSNLEAVNITGYEEWEAIGRNFSMFYTKEDRETGVPEQDLAKAQSDNRLTFSGWRVKKRNVTFWAQVTMSSLRDEDGRVTGYKMILRDQTHRLISNNRLKRFRTEYLNVLNNPFIGIVKFRVRDFKIMLINGTAGKIIGMRKEPKRFNEIFRLDDQLKTFFDLLIKDGKVSGFEFQLNLEKVSWGRIDCQLFPDEGFAEGIVTDITESKTQMLELKRLNDELDSFIYHASHDLRSPLTSLLGLINLIESDTEIELKDYCGMMRDRVTYLDELLRDMASIAFNSKSDVTIEAIDFKEITQRLIEEFQPVYASIPVSVELKRGPVFCSDRQRILMIFKNLIANSLKHHNPLERNPFIRIEIEIFKDKARIKFKDNGRGIKDDQLLQIFGMFYKANDGVKETGLGLYIAKLMIDKLKGTIRVKSKTGMGTEFEIELPNLKALAESTYKYQVNSHS